VMLCGWEVKAGWLIWKVKLCDPSLTRANLSALQINIAKIMKRCTDVLFTALTYLLYVSASLWTNLDLRAICCILQTKAKLGNATKSHYIYTKHTSRLHVTLEI